MNQFTLHLNKKLSLCLLQLMMGIQYLAAQSATYDSTFNSTGILYTNANNVITVQRDQKLLCAGGAGEIKLQRFNNNGTPDSNFGINGSVPAALGANGERILSVSQQTNGKINVDGTAGGRVALAQYLPNGKPDSNFHDNGLLLLNTLPAYTGVSAIAKQPDGKIIIAGNLYDTSITINPSFFAARYNTDGTLDKSFGVNGITHTSFSLPATANALAVQPDGKIIIIGRIETRDFAGILMDSLAVTRYNANGSLDSGFNDTGKLTMVFADNTYHDSGAEGKAIILLPDGKILIGCNDYYGHNHGEWVWGNFVLLRLMENGKLDSSFNGNAVKIIPGSRPVDLKLAYQSDHKIILAGTSAIWEFLYQSHIFVFRINNDGTTDTSFGADGMQVLDYDDPYSYKSMIGIALGNNRIYITGAEEFNSYNLAVFTIEHNGIPFNPVTRDACIGTAAIDISSDIQGANYQWEMSTDNSTFNSISNNDYYSGADAATLSLHNIPASWSGYQYRCIVGNSMSNTTTLYFLNGNENEWTGMVSNEWENPANWLCGSIPGTNSKVIINTGSVVIHSNVDIADIHIRDGASVTVANGSTLAVAAKQSF